MRKRVMNMDIGPKQKASSSELDRVEKMFDKTIWLIGILTTVFIAGSVIVFLTLNQNVTTTANDAKASIKKTLEEATNSVVDKLSAQIDLKAITNQIIESSIPKVRNELETQLQIEKYKMTSEVADLSGKYLELKQQADGLKKTLDQLLVVQSISKQSEITIYGIVSSTTLPKLGLPIVVNFSLSAPNLDKSNLLEVQPIILFNGYQITLDRILIKGTNIIEVSVPLGKDTRTDKGIIQLPSIPGKYSIELRIFTTDRKLLLEQETSSIEYFNI